MSTISSLSPRPLLYPCPPESSATPAKTSAASSTASRTGVEAYRENDKNQGWVGKALESHYLGMLQHVPPGGKLEVSTQGMVRLEAAGELKARAEVERLEDGSYQLTFRGGVGVGLAGSAGEGGPKGSAMVGAQGAVTLRFESAGEAADRLAALAQAEVQTAMGLTGRVAVWLGLLDSDAMERSEQLLKNVASFEAGLYGELKGELEVMALKLGARVVGEGTFRVDVREGKLVYEQSLQAQVEGGGKGDFEQLGASAEGKLLLQSEVALTKEELERLKKGTLLPQEVLSPGRVRRTVTQEVKLEVAVGPQAKESASVSAKRTFPLEELKGPARLLDLRGEWEVSATQKRSLGQDKKWELDASVVELKAEASLEEPLFDKPRKLSLGEVKGSVLAAQARARDHEQLLQARRAMGR